MIKTPWNDKQIRALEEYQNAEFFHPYTCGNNSLHENLIPTPSGWICPNCDYKQNWANIMDTDLTNIKIFIKASENANKLPETEW